MHRHPLLHSLSPLLSFPLFSPDASSLSLHSLILTHSPQASCLLLRLHCSSSSLASGPALLSCGRTGRGLPIPPVSFCVCVARVPHSPRVLLCSLVAEPDEDSPFAATNSLVFYNMDNGQGNRQATSEIDLINQNLLGSMSEEIEAMPLIAEESRCIYRVPRGLGGGFSEIYQPQVVSIGPYHHGESHLQALQWHKKRYLRIMLERVRSYGILLENLIRIVEPQEKMIRGHYSDSTDHFSASKLVEMMVVDGCFILEVLRRIAKCIPPDNTFSVGSFMHFSIMRDFMRLENQIPYFVLKDLCEVTDIPENPTPLDDLVFSFYKEFLHYAGDGRECCQEGVHLLDTLRLILVQEPDIYSVDSSFTFTSIRSASELYRVGFTFTPSAASFLGITFDTRHRTIGLPLMSIEDPFNCILPNMVAFEQSAGKKVGYISTYAVFMGCLIRTAEDMQILRNKRIILDRGLSNEDIAGFYRDLSKGVVVEIRESHLAWQFTMVNRALRHERAYLCWAQLVNGIRDNPWSVLSGLAIIVTLVGLLQTVYTLLQYYHPR